MSNVLSHLLFPDVDGLLCCFALCELVPARPWGAGVAFAHPDDCAREGAARDELVDPKKRSGHSLTQHGWFNRYGDQMDY
jgi:hypothetical protein